MAKRNRKKIKSKRMKHKQENGITKSNSKYAQKKRLQIRGIFNPGSPFNG